MSFVRQFALCRSGGAKVIHSDLTNSSSYFRRAISNQYLQLNGARKTPGGFDFNAYFDIERTMESIVVSEFGDPSVLKFSKENQAPKPEAGQYLVRLHAIGVNPVETYIRSGNYARLPPLPYTPGKDGAGVIEAVGEEVKEGGGGGNGSGSKKPKHSVGDRVYVYGALSGSYAGYTTSSFDHTFALPEKVKFEQGACIGIPGFTAYRALVAKAKARSGEKVLVHGASGGVGLFTVQIARALGCQVFGTASSAEGRRLVMEAGAVDCFDHNEEGYINKMKGVVPTGFDVCIEMLASSNLSNDLTIMGTQGRVVIVGSRGPISINPRDIMMRELLVTGVMSAASTNEELETAANFLQEGLLSGAYSPIVGLRLPLSKASVAHEEVINTNRSYNGNIVLIPDLIHE